MIGDFIWLKRNLAQYERLGQARPIVGIKENMTLEQQYALMGSGKDSAKLWLACQRWVSGNLLLDFVKSSDTNILRLWWSNVDQDLIKPLLNLSELSEALAIKGVELDLLAGRVPQPEAQMEVWKHIMKRDQRGETAALAGGKLARNEHLNRVVRREMIEYIKESVRSHKNRQPGFLCFEEEEFFQKNKEGLTGRWRGAFNQALKYNQRAHEDLAYVVLGGLVENRALESDEMKEIVNEVISLCTWPMDIVTRRGREALGVREPDEGLKRDWREISDMIWAKILRRLQTLKEVSPGRFDYLIMEETNIMNNILDCYGRIGDTKDDVINSRIMEVRDVMPSNILKTLSRWPVEQLKNVKQKSLAGYLTDDNKECREQAIVLLGKIGQSRKSGEKSRI